jgi:hypothetical protein
VSCERGRTENERETTKYRESCGKKIKGVEWRLWEGRYGREGKGKEREGKRIESEGEGEKKRREGKGKERMYRKDIAGGRKGKGGERNWERGEGKEREGGRGRVRKGCIERIGRAGEGKGEGEVKASTW